MSPTHDERRPVGRTALEDQAGGPIPNIVPPAPDNDLAAAHEAFRNCYAVLVRGKAARRHLYFNLPAAERAVRRARARGDRAEMLLVRLVPVAGEAR